MKSSQVALEVKNPPANVGDKTGSIPVLGKWLGSNGNPLQYSALRILWTEPERLHNPWGQSQTGLTIQTGFT